MTPPQTPNGVTSATTLTRPQTSFVGDVTRLVSGTVVAQLLGILVSPILTRLFAPEDFGLLALFTSITAIIGVIACLRYELAIMLPESDEEAANLLGVSLLFSVLTALLTIPIIWWGKDLVLRWLNAPGLAPYVWLVPPMALFSGVFAALNYWNSRTKQFGRLSAARVSQSLLTVAVQICGGVAGFVNGGTLIGAGVGGRSIATIVLGGQIWRDDSKLFLHSINWRRMVEGVRRHRKFPLYSSWSGLLNTISWQLPALMLGAFFPSSVVGYYALGFRILQLPMSLIGNALGQVFFQRAAEARSNGTLTLFVEKVFERLVLLGLFPMLVMGIIGKDLYGITFGPTWAEAGVYTQILSVWGFFWFISSPLTTLFSVLEKQEFGLRFNLILVVVRSFALGIGGLSNNARLAMILFSLSGVLLYGYLTVIIMIAAGTSQSKLWSTLGQALKYSTPPATVLLVFVTSGATSWLVVIVATILVGVYGLVIWKKHPILFSMRTH